MPCPCCGYLTMSEPGLHEICPVCFWHDDGFTDLDEVSAPNHITLRQGQENFRRFGACEEKFRVFVRDPRPGEHPAAASP